MPVKIDAFKKAFSTKVTEDQYKGRRSDTIAVIRQTEEFVKLLGTTEVAKDAVKTLAEANGKSGVSLSPEARALLEQAPWPGNVRELQNFLERLLVLSPSTRIEAADVERELDQRPSAGRLQPAGMPLDDARRQAERDALKSALDRANNNRTQAARLLGVSRRTLYNKLDEHGLA